MLDVQHCVCQCIRVRECVCVGGGVGVTVSNAKLNNYNNIIITKSCTMVSLLTKILDTCISETASKEILTC